MVAARVLASGSRCLKCQQHVLQSFITGLGTVGRRTSAQRQPLPVQGQRRQFSGNVQLRIADAKEPVDARPNNDLDDLTTSSRPIVDDATVEKASPWYLQDQPQGSEQNPFAERQRIPELPSNPPPILENLLKHISIDLGLDYLSIIDLRKLDPPPALGSNLVMILASARSERHLNVSADRLCRWLRTNYKLSPYADGLLGRNELKLKLKRRARRSRMLGAAGATDPNDLDDGITTGWVCVNVGAVEDGESSVLEEDDNFIGFGKRSSDAKIVVQMLTEEKRGEVDLEGLWQSALDRAARKEKRDREAVAQIQSTKEDFLTGTNTNASGTYEEPASALLRPGLNQHVRGLHTSRPLRHADEPSRDEDEYHGLSDIDVEPRLLFRSNDDDQTQASKSFRNRDDRTSDGLQNPLHHESTALSLRTKLDYLSKLPMETALEVLGTGQDDKSSTSFLASFFQDKPLFAQPIHIECELELQCFGVSMGHSGYDKQRLFDMLLAAQGSSSKLSENVYMLVFETLLLAPHALPKNWESTESTKDGLHSVRLGLRYGFDVLEMMENSGYGALSDTVFTILHRAVTSPSFVKASDASSTLTVSAKDLETLQKRVRRSMDLLHQYQSENLYIEMLSAYSKMGNWRGFWDVWRSQARIMRSRTANFYKVLFTVVSETDDQSFCLEVLREVAPEMKREKKPVEMSSELAVALLECLGTAQADPADLEWRSLFHDCQQALRDTSSRHLEHP